MRTVVHNRVMIFYTATCLCFTACCLFISSCASTDAVKKADSGYISVLEKLTREGKFYDSFETKVLISATFKDLEFREYYSDEYVKTFMLQAEKADKMKNAEVEASKSYHEFFFSIHTPNIEWSDLEKKDPLWALYLVNNAGERVSPIYIKRVKEKGPAVTRFYPYFTEWSIGYIVRFPLNLPDGREFMTIDTEYIKLVLTGSPGKGELVWKLKTNER